jgi:hypothetical protein
LIFGAAALCVLGAAVFVFIQSERQVDAVRASEQAFDRHVRAAVSALGELRTSQSAYVAAGQGVAFWMPKVGTTVESVRTALAALRDVSTTNDSRTALDDAAASVADFVTVDHRARDYIRAGQPLMAADVIYTEGVETAASASRQVEAAIDAERRSAETSLARLRRQEAVILGGAVLALAVALLALVPLPSAEPSVTDEPPIPAPTSVEDGRPALGEAGSRPSTYGAARFGTALKAASELCTDLGRAGDVEEFRTLLGRAAEILDASGLVVWVGAAGGLELEPVLSHGYSSQVLARMPKMPRSADNAAAAAFRSGQLQIVLARPGSSAGAIVAPLLSSEGCIGALSAEIRGGGETSDSVQALAAIVAAQLAGALQLAPVEQDRAASGTA